MATDVPKVRCEYEGQDFDESEFVTYKAEGDVREHFGHPPRHLENGLEIPPSAGGGGGGGGGAYGRYGHGPVQAPDPGDDV